MASSAEQFSQHPLAKAVLAYARTQSITTLEPTAFRNVPGRGVDAEVDGRRIIVGSIDLLRECGVRVPVGDIEATGRIAVHVGREIEYVGRVELDDELRPGARQALATLHDLNVTTAILTGDHEVAAQRVAQSVGVADVRAGLMPEQKLAEVGRRKADGHQVAFIGDGINDAPALAAADVGMTFAMATDIATTTADITFVHANLDRIPRLIQLARRSVRVIRQNLFWAFFYNLCAIPLAATGRVGPGIAAAAMMCSSISVVLNSLRLRAGKERTDEHGRG